MSALQRDYETSKSFLMSLKEEVSRLNPKENDFDVQEFNQKDIKRALETTIEQTSSQKDMKITDEASILLSKALEIFTLDLAFKSELKSKEQCRTIIEASDTHQALKSWDNFDVFQSPLR